MNVYNVDIDYFDNLVVKPAIRKWLEVTAKNIVQKVGKAPFVELMLSRNFMAPILTLYFKENESCPRDTFVDFMIVNTKGFFKDLDLDRDYTDDQIQVCDAFDALQMARLLVARVFNKSEDCSVPISLSNYK